jgi:hypothetical protein
MARMILVARSRRCLLFVFVAGPQDVLQTLLGWWFIGGLVVILTGHTVFPRMRMIGDSSRRRRRVVVIAAVRVNTRWVLVFDIVAGRRVMTVVLMRIRLVFIAVRPMVIIIFHATSSKG